MTLSPRQKALLRTLVEAGKVGTTEENRTFLVASSLDGSFILPYAGSELPDPVDEADVHILVDHGYVGILKYNKNGEPVYYVTNEGIEFISADTAERGPQPFVQQAVSLVDEKLPPEFGRASELMKEAVSKLVQAQEEHGWSEVGHKCREALQEFAEVLYTQHVPSSQQESIPREKTVQRLKAVVRQLRGRVGDTTSQLLDTLIEYWRAVSDLVNKVEHRSQREDRPLTWDDARRAVLYSYLVMAELARVAERK